MQGFFKKVKSETSKKLNKCPRSIKRQKYLRNRKSVPDLDLLKVGVFFESGSHESAKK